MYPQTLKPQFVCGEGPSKNVLMKLTMFHSDRHMAKSIKMKKVCTEVFWLLDWSGI
jgi:hypothetical protein